MQVDNIQLVHESVLSIDHFFRNVDGGIVTVVMLDAASSIEANSHIQALKERLGTKTLPDNARFFCLRGRKPSRPVYDYVLNALSGNTESQMIT